MTKSESILTFLAGIAASLFSSSILVLGQEDLTFLSGHWNGRPLLGTAALAGATVVLFLAGHRASESADRRHAATGSRRGTAHDDEHYVWPLAWLGLALGLAGLALLLTDRTLNRGAS